MHNGAAGPLWLSVLVASAEWGTPPWELAGGSKVTWWLRWVEYQTQRAKKQELDDKQWRTSSKF